jgi:dipeptidyl-peptidase-4
MLNQKSIYSLLIIIFLNGLLYGQESDRKLSVADFWKTYTFTPKSVSGIRSMNDGEHYTAIRNGQQIVKYAYETGEEVAVLFDATEDSLIRGIRFYTFSSDESKLLIPTQIKRIYRRSFTATYFVVNLPDGTIKPLSVNGPQQLATFAPKGNRVAFVRENNLFVVDLNTGEEQQITTDGQKNYIINGAPDWVYEEEFEFNKAFAWSPKGDRLAYMKFDESQVKEFHMTMFAGEAPRLSKNDPYPAVRKWKYPKAGEDNAIVSVHIFDLKTNTTINVDVGEETDQYIPRIRWTKNNDLLAVFRLNRLQNFFEVLLADAISGKSEVMYAEENKYYIDETNFDFLTFLEDGKHFMYVGEMDGWNHLYLMDMEGQVVKKLTDGPFDVTDVYGYDEKRRKAYFQAAMKSPLQREVYGVNFNGKKLKQLSKKAGTSAAAFSNSFDYYIQTFSNAKTPPVYSLHDRKGNQIRVLEDNQALLEKLASYKPSLKTFFSFRTSEDVLLHGYMIKPVGFDSTKKYPVLMTQYSGPNSQEALDSWSFDWHNYLAQEGYLVVCVDGRGTAARGEEFRKMTYLQLGHYEVIDQIETAKYLARQPYVDAGNIAIWGWSYGGFMTCLALTKGEGLFDAGIAVAPVTNWRYYDNIYTERFMRTPQENRDGYEDNSPLNFADQLQGSLLLIHGSGDDNVHVQNTFEFAEKLVQADKDFDMHIYTNRNHSIYGGNTRYHLFKKMTRFLNSHLKD